MRYSNVKIKWRLAEKINEQLLVHWNESERRKILRLALDQVVSAVAVGGPHQGPRFCPKCWYMQYMHRVYIVFQVCHDLIWFLSKDDNISQYLPSMAVYVRRTKWQWRTLCCSTCHFNWCVWNIFFFLYMILTLISLLLTGSFFELTLPHHSIFMWCFQEVFL